MQRHSFVALNSTFVVDHEYQFVKELGQGAYGCVVAAKHAKTGEGCAIKKITNINTKVSLEAAIITLYATMDRTADIDEEMSPRDQVRDCDLLFYLHKLI
jgi:serine/threonine protein kinase